MVQISSDEGIQDLWSMLAESAMFPEQVRVVEYLTRYAANALARTSIMGIAHLIFLRKGAARIAELSHHAVLNVVCQ
jgi:hypothetical protein